MVTLYAIRTYSHVNKVQEVIYSYYIIHFTTLDVTQKAKIIKKKISRHTLFDLHLISWYHS